MSCQTISRAACGTVAPAACSSQPAITAGFVVFFPLAAVGQMASLAFLIVYGTVSVGHLRVYRETGANPWLLVPPWC